MSFVAILVLQCLSVSKRSITAQKTLWLGLGISNTSLNTFEVILRHITNSNVGEVQSLLEEGTESRK